MVQTIMSTYHEHQSTSTSIPHGNQWQIQKIIKSIVCIMQIVSVRSTHMHAFGCGHMRTIRPPAVTRGSMDPTNPPGSATGTAATGILEWYNVALTPALPPLNY